MGAAGTLSFVLLLCEIVVIATALNLYTHPLNPKDNPDYDRYSVKHPTRETFNNTIKFATLRSFTMENNKIINYRTSLEQYCLNRNTSLGTIIWPRYPYLFSSDFEKVVDMIAEYDIFVSDIWGFVPGSGPGIGKDFGDDPWQEFILPAKRMDYLEKKLGEKWLGMDIGEQDGRYLGGYASELIPLNVDRKLQYLDFREHFRVMEDMMGPKLVSLVVTTFPHYMAKTGLYTLIGAETAQRETNAQLFYAFLRGAGKQYGVLWFGNVSVYNRWGNKNYPSAGTSQATSQTAPAHYTPPDHSESNYTGTVTRNYTCPPKPNDNGPTCGTSLNLMKRLMYAHMMYGCAYLSFEHGWFVGHSSTFTPIGKIQHAAKEFVDANGLLGVHVATVGLYLDFFVGFLPARTDFTGRPYHSWRSLPYSEGDYLADGILRTMYPQYQDSSYFHDETGFSSPTPYGDTLDALLSDAPVWVLSQYNTLIAASNLTGGFEVKDNLEQYVLGGGNLVMTAGNVAKLPGGILGITTELDCKNVGSGAKVYLFTGDYEMSIMEKYNMTVCSLNFPPNHIILASVEDSIPLAVQVQIKDGGSLTVFATPFAISSDAVARPLSEIDVSLPSPYPLLDHARVLLDAILTNATLFTSTANLSLVPTYIDKEHFHLLVTNPELKEQPLKLLSPQGIITSVEEIPLDQSEKGDVGYLPDGFQGTDIGNSTNTTIAGGDTRLFKVSLSSDSLQILPKVQPKPRPKGVALHLRKIEHSIRYEILLRPTFFQHYDSVMVDYAYLIDKDDEFLNKEAQWLEQQDISIYVDASPAIDLFPFLRLVNNSAPVFNQSIHYFVKLMRKMYNLGSTDLIISLHRTPENNFSPTETLASFNETLHLLLNYASQYHITLHMQDALKNPFGDEFDLASWMKDCGLGSVKIVLNTAVVLDQILAPSFLVKHSSFILIDAPAYDLDEYRYSVNLPLAKADPNVRVRLRDWISGRINSVKGSYPFVMDGYFASHDDEYLDVKILEETLS